MGGPENDNFLLLYLVKMSFNVDEWVVQKSLKIPLRIIKMTPYGLMDVLKDPLTIKIQHNNFTIAK